MTIPGFRFTPSKHFSLRLQRSVERSCSDISGLLVRPWSPLALMEYPRVFISISLPASKGPWMERISENTGPTALPSL